MIGDIIFGMAILLAVGYAIWSREKYVNISELSEVKRWHVKGYVSSEDVSSAVSADGKMTQKSYNILKNKVDRMRAIRALTDEKPEKPKVSTKTQVVRIESGSKDAGSKMETVDT